VTTAPAAPVWLSQLRVTQLRVVRSEWTKFRSLRSTLWSLFTAIALAIGFSCLAAVITVVRWSHMSFEERLARNPVTIALIGVNLSQLALSVLGVLFISSEYSTGMIRATMSAVPLRLPVLWAKVAVFAAVTLAVTIPCVLIDFFATQAILGSHQILKISFTAPGVPRTILGGALYLTVIGVFALGLGAITRNTAGGIAVFVAIFFVIPPLMNILPTNWNNAISEYLPSSAGRDVFAIFHGSHDLAPWPGFALFVGYTTLVIAIAAVLLARRDV
jgi:ABC-2 type transport system permease protein